MSEWTGVGAGLRGDDVWKEGFGRVLYGGAWERKEAGEEEDFGNHLPRTVISQWPRYNTNM